MGTQNWWAVDLDTARQTDHNVTERSFMSGGESVRERRGDRGDRVAVVAGLRTPFAKQGTSCAGLSALQLGCTVVRELLERTSLDTKEV